MDIVLYALGGLLIGAIAGALDSGREHQSAILGAVVAGPFGLFAALMFARDQECLRLGGTPGDTCPEEADFNILAGALPIIGLVIAAIGGYFLVSELVTSRANRGQ